MTYLVFLLILMGIYAVYWMVALLGLRVGNRARFQKVRYRAPLYSVLFLFLAVYDYLYPEDRDPDSAICPLSEQHYEHCLDRPGNADDRTLYTLRLLFLGYFIGVALGLVTGITCGYSARIRYWVDPIIKFLGPIPTSTWIPIIMVVTANLFGGSIFIIALGSWFAVTVASMTGISNVDRDYFEAARTLGGQRGAPAGVPGGDPQVDAQHPPGNDPGHEYGLYRHHDRGNDGRKSGSWLVYDLGKILGSL